MPKILTNSLPKRIYPVIVVVICKSKETSYIPKSRTLRNGVPLFRITYSDDLYSPCSERPTKKTNRDKWRL